MDDLPDYFDPNSKIKIDPLWEELDISPGEEEFIETKQDHLFHIGQYNQGLAKTVYCKHCGGKEFNVGQEYYFTAIRCTTCEYEVCIHEG